MNPIRAALLAAAFLCPLAAAQDLQPNQRIVQLSGGPRVFETMAVPGADGKIVRIDGPHDLTALQRNALVTEAVRERLRPAIREWVAELDRVAIDNLDFLERLEPADGSPGVLADLDSTSTVQMRHINQIMTQLGAAGNLSNHLNASGLLDRDAHALNQHIVAEYLQRCLAEVAPHNEQIRDQAQSQDRTNRYNRFLFSVSASDAMGAYHRLLAEAAPNLDRLVASLQLPAPQAEDLKAAISDAGKAQNPADRRRAVRAVLDKLSFDQRRAVLALSREMAPPFEPFPGQPSAQANPAAKSGG